MKVKVTSIIAMSLVMAGCFVKPGDDKLAQTASVPITPVYKTAIDSFLQASGSCGSNTGIDFTYSGVDMNNTSNTLTPSQTVQGNCGANGAASSGTSLNT